MLGIKVFSEVKATKQYLLPGTDVASVVYYSYSGRKVKIKASSESVDGVVDQTHFIAKLSSDGYYFYSTAKADVRLGDCIIKEVQFRDLVIKLMVIVVCVIPLSHCTSHWFVCIYMCYQKQTIEFD